jgi:hypothetical protein
MFRDTVLGAHLDPSRARQWHRPSIFGPNFYSSKVAGIALDITPENLHVLGDFQIIQT